MKEKNKIEIFKNGVKFIFRGLNINDIHWLNDSFSEKNKPVGFINFQEKISNFDNYAELAQTLTIVMHYLLIFPEELSLEQFEEQFGITYTDIALLYSQGLNYCVGNTEKDTRKNSKIVRQNNQLKKENRMLQNQLLLEKCKTFKRTVKGLIA
jgi:hypothetical protein